MKTFEEIRTGYRSIISETKSKLATTQRQIYNLGTLRLFLFVAGIAGVIYFWSSGWLFIVPVALFTFIPFLVLIKHHNRLFHKKEYFEKKIEINGQELSGMDYDNSAFGSGKEFICQEHLYTYDLDVFGDRSLFQLVNRTCTEMGNKQLAQWFDEHLLRKEEIEARQAAIRELAADLSFRQEFRIQGLLYKGKVADEEEINQWVKSPGYYRSQRMLRALPLLAFSTNIILVALAILNVISFNVCAIVFASFVIESFAFSKGISKFQSMYGKKLQILGAYARLIRLMEDKEVESSLLIQVKSLLKGEKMSASESVGRLSAQMSALDQRNNMLMMMMLNGLFFWELRQTMQIEAWKEESAAELPKWIEAIKQMDALCSLATFSYNNPDYIFPQVEENRFVMEAKELGHPLMERKKCVRNDIMMTQRPSFIIITGANMAGKSTYLRTIGVNHLMACIGAPVFASEMRIHPTRLVTSLRTTDSLNDNESYFFAELKRLKLIIDRLNEGKELFIILDEILKGTNSMDKQKGSFALVSQFISLKATGIIATHDLLLGSLADKFPEEIRNFRFEADIKGDELTFSYRLQPGVAQNMNACFLMGKMGITV